MKKQFRILAVLLCIAMLAVSLAACGSEDTPATTTQGNNAQTTTPPQNDVVTERLDANGYLMDDLPETYDWDKDFTVYSWQEQKNWEWCLDSAQTTDAVNLALYNRIQSVEQRFNVTMQFRFEPGNWDNRRTFVSTLAANVNNGDGFFDLVGQYTPAAGIAAAQKLYKDLNSLDYLDFTKPWWPSMITETATIGDKLYFATGDITPTLIKNIHCMFVNMDMYEAMNISALYGDRDIFTIVKDGDWTFETMKEMGMNRVDTAQGKLGITFLNDVCSDAFFFAAGYKLLKNENGILSLSDDLVNINMINYYDEVQDLYSTGNYDDVAINNSAFSANNSFLYVGGISDAQTFTKKEVDFSILPMPKLDTNQDRYYTIASFWVTLYSIPVDVKNEEMSAMIMEGLASEAYRSVTDVIYFDMFAARFMQTPEKAEMLDWVSDSVVFDSARMFPDFLGSIWSSFRNGVNGTDAWTTIYGEAADGWKLKADSLFTQLG